MHIHITIMRFCCVGGLDTSGNLRPSPLPASGASKLTALQKALHGKEVRPSLELIFPWEEAGGVDYRVVRL